LVPEGKVMGGRTGISRPVSIKLRDVQTRITKEKDGSYAIACSALGVYSVGKTLTEAKHDFEEALELHLSALKEKAIEAVGSELPVVTPNRSTRNQDQKPWRSEGNLVQSRRSRRESPHSSSG